MGMYFGGAHFEFDTHDLTDNPVLAAHFVHSVTRLQYNKGKITHWKGMEFQEFWENNKDFFNAVVRKYKRERNYDIQERSISYAINWFLSGVNK